MRLYLFKIAECSRYEDGAAVVIARDRAQAMDLLREHCAKDWATAKVTFMDEEPECEDYSSFCWVYKQLQSFPVNDTEPRVVLYAYHSG